MTLDLVINPLQINPSYWAIQIFNGLVLGMIFILISIGLSIIFGMMGVVNFAHGDLLLLGTYVAWTVSDLAGSFLLGLILAPIVVSIVAGAFERYGLRRIYHRSPIIQLLFTFGFAEFLRGGIMLIWGRQGKNFPIPNWAGGSVDLVIFSYPVYRVFVIVGGALLVIATYLFLTRTEYGLIIRAGTQDREMVDALGIDISWIFLLVFILGSAIVGLGGALIGPIQGARPALGLELLVPAFVVVIIGGMGSFRGSVIAGLLVGIVISVTSITYGAAAEVMIYVIMAIILLLRPRGLFGREGVIET